MIVVGGGMMSNINRKCNISLLGSVMKHRCCRSPMNHTPQFSIFSFSVLKLEQVRGTATGSCLGSSDKKIGFFPLIQDIGSSIYLIQRWRRQRWSILLSQWVYGDEVRCSLMMQDYDVMGWPYWKNYLWGILILLSEGINGSFIEYCENWWNMTVRIRPTVCL